MSKSFGSKHFQNVTTTILPTTFSSQFLSLGCKTRHLLKKESNTDQSTWPLRSKSPKEWPAFARSTSISNANSSKFYQTSQSKTNAASTAPSKQPQQSTNAKPHPTAQLPSATNSPSFRRTDGWKESAISQNPTPFTSPTTKATKTSPMPTPARTKICISSAQWENKSDKA